MYKIKYQLESAIQNKISKLLLANFVFIIEGNPTQLSHIVGVKLHQPDGFDDILRDGKSHFISLQGVVRVIQRTKNGSVLVHLFIRQSNVLIKFNWETQDFTIEDIEKFRFYKSTL